MNTGAPLPVLLDHFKWNLDRLAEILKNPKTDYFRDAALQRFGFTLEGAERCIQSAANKKEQSPDSMEASLSFANTQGWLRGDIPWQSLESSYRSIKSKDNKQQADELFDQLPTIYLEFDFLFAKLNEIAQTDSQ